MASRSYTTECSICFKKFKSLYTLKKHCILKHPYMNLENLVPIFKDQENIASLPIARDLSGLGQFDSYKVWLAGLVERINSTFHPRLPSKWVRIDSHQVPKHYFEHFLHRLKVHANSVQERAHRGQPGYFSSTLRVSYKLFEGSCFFEALEEQNLVEVNEEVLFEGDRVEHDVMNLGLNANEFLKKAKEKASLPRLLRKRASSKSTLEVGYGEGRATREVELIWWPNLFSITDHGRLVIRMFITKCEL